MYIYNAVTPTAQKAPGVTGACSVVAQRRWLKGEGSHITARTWMDTCARTVQRANLLRCQCVGGDSQLIVRALWVSPAAANRPARGSEGTVRQTACDSASSAFDLKKHKKPIKCSRDGMDAGRAP